MSLLGRVASLLDIRGKSVRRGRRVKREGREKEMEFTSIYYREAACISNTCISLYYMLPSMETTEVQYRV